MAQAVGLNTHRHRSCVDLPAMAGASSMDYKCNVDENNKATELPLLRLGGTVQQNPHMRATTSMPPAYAMGAAVAGLDSGQSLGAKYSLSRDGTVADWVIRWLLLLLTISLCTGGFLFAVFTGEHGYMRGSQQRMLWFASRLPLWPCYGGLCAQLLVFIIVGMMATTFGKLSGPFAGLLRMRRTRSVVKRSASKALLRRQRHYRRKIRSGLHCWGPPPKLCRVPRRLSWRRALRDLRMVSAAFAARIQGRRRLRWARPRRRRLARTLHVKAADACWLFGQRCLLKSAGRDMRRNSVLGFGWDGIALRSGPGQCRTADCCGSSKRFNKTHWGKQQWDRTRGPRAETKRRWRPTSTGPSGAPVFSSLCDRPCLSHGSAGGMLGRRILRHGVWMILMCSVLAFWTSSFSFSVLSDVPMPRYGTFVDEPFSGANVTAYIFEMVSCEMRHDMCLECG